MKAKKLEWIEKENFFEAKSACNDYWFHKQKFRLFYNLGILGVFDNIEQAKQAAQDHADKMVADMIDPDLHVLTNEQMLEVIKIAMNEQVKNDLVESITLAPEDVLVKVLLHLEKEKA